MEIGGGLGFPHNFGPDPNFVGSPGNYIAFGHQGTAEDFIGYKDNTFYFKDSPGGADINDPTVVVGGKLGIGTSTPQRKLQIGADAAGIGFEGSIASPHAGAIRFGDNSGWKFYIGRSREIVNGPLNSGPTGALITIEDKGNVGIGITSAARKLHVEGNAIRLSTPGNANRNVELRTDGVAVDLNGIGADLFVHSTTGNTILQAFSGNVGIGTTNPTAKLYVAGSFTATGTKAATVETNSFGKRKLYAVESATVRFNDEGKGKLERGTATIQLDPVFLETVEGELMIHLTSYGPTSLYVAERGNNYFVVNSLDGKNVQFAWQVSALRKGYANVRLEKSE